MAASLCHWSTDILPETNKGKKQENKKSDNGEFSDNIINLDIGVSKRITHIDQDAGPDELAEKIQREVTSERNAHQTCGDQRHERKTETHGDLGYK